MLVVVRVVRGVTTLINERSFVDSARSTWVPRSLGKHFSFGVFVDLCRYLYLYSKGGMFAHSQEGLGDRVVACLSSEFVRIF